MLFSLVYKVVTHLFFCLPLDSLFDKALQQALRYYSMQMEGYRPYRTPIHPYLVYSDNGSALESSS